MAGGKLPPRQKMIGMMYLVLTALLAMNISKDILNAFVMINDSLEATNKTFAYKNGVAYAAFDKAYGENPAKVKPHYDKANQAKEWAKELIEHIDKLKLKLIRETDKKDPVEFPDDSLRLRTVDSKDNYDIPTHLLIGSEPAKPINGPFTATELKQKIEDLRGKLLSLIDEKNRAKMNIGLVLEGGVENEVVQTWETLNFNHVPLAAVITVLTKLQTDIRNAEADVVKQLFSAVDAADFKFDAITAKVIAPTSYVLLGEDYVADIFVAAYSTTQNPQVLVGDLDTTTNTFRGSTDSVPVVEGMGKYVKKPTSEGLVKYGGLINIKAPDGSIKSYPYTGEYMVAKPALVVSPTKMNVLYIGVDNPIDISVPGIAAENLVPSLSGGSLSGAKGKYTARVTSGTKATISVSAKFGTQSKSMGTFEFRVKSLPNPEAKFGGKTGSASISKNDLVNTAGVIADMGDFLFDLKFDIVGFDVVATINGFEKSSTSRNNKVTEEQKGLLKVTKPGTKVWIENVKAKGPDGKIRDLSPISLKIL